VDFNPALMSPVAETHVQQATIAISRRGARSICTACIFWLKDRRPQDRRDAQQLEHVLGKYIIADRPLTEEEWTRERATVIDVTPEK
jgi:hypothetical protein